MLVSTSQISGGLPARRDSKTVRAPSTTIPLAWNVIGSVLETIRTTVPRGQMAEVLKALGAAPVPLQMPDVYESLKRGVIDGVTVDLSPLKYWKFAEVIKEFSWFKSKFTLDVPGPNDYTIGGSFWEFGGPDLDRAKLFVMIGTAEDHHSNPLKVAISKFKRRGGRFISINPVRTGYSAIADEWIPIKPGTDGALFLALGNEIIKQGLYDRDYVDRYCSGFAELARHVQPFTPEWAWLETGLEPAQIRETARAMAHAAPATLVHPGRHVTWYGDDTQRCRAIAILNALLGSWGRRGGFYIPEKASLPKMKLPPYPKVKRTWRDAFPGEFPMANLALAGMGEAEVAVAAEVESRPSRVHRLSRRTRA